MPSIEKRARGGRVRWYARYRSPDGAQRTKTFDRKADAERYLNGIEAAKLSGSYIDPATSRISVGEWSRLWLDGQAHLKPSTRERYAGILRAHLMPQWDHVRLSDVSHADVQAWVSTLSRARSPATVRKIHRVLSLVLDMAVADGRLARNPASQIRLPRVVAGERRYLTHQQVHALADACGEHYRLIVLFLAYTGTRFGEMAALRVSRLDLVRHRAVIAASVTLVNGDLTWGTPKGHDRREVPVPRFVNDQLRSHVAGRDPDDLVFTGPRGAVLRAQTMQRASFARAADAIGVPGLHLHELRHTAASLAIASRADVKVVQRMLGHKSATMTLDLYGHLFSDRLDEVASAMDLAARAAVPDVYPMCTGTPRRPSPPEAGDDKTPA